MFHIAMTMGYIKSENVLHENEVQVGNIKNNTLLYGRSVIGFYRHRYNARRRVQYDRASSSFGLYRFAYHFHRAERPRQGQAAIGRQCRFRRGLPPCRHACRLFHDIRQLREGQDALCRHPAVQSILQGLERLQSIRSRSMGLTPKKPRQV